MSLASRDRLFGQAMAAPGLLALLALVVIPVAATLVTSTLDLTPDGARFVGLSHYAAALGGPELPRSLLLTGAFALAVASVELALGLVLALALTIVGRHGAFYRAVLLLPLALSLVAAGLVWRALLDPASGGLLGLGPADWLGDPATAFWTLVGVDAWRHVPLMALLLLAGLAVLPRGLYETARLEGAGRLRAFLGVMLPALWPAVAAALLLRLVLALGTFDLVYVVTRGGPGQATGLVSYVAYRDAFLALDVGRACATAAILLLIVLPLTAWLHGRIRRLATS